MNGKDGRDSLADPVLKKELDFPPLAMASVRNGVNCVL